MKVAVRLVPFFTTDGILIHHLYDLANLFMLKNSVNQAKSVNLIQKPQPVYTAPASRVSILYSLLKIQQWSAFISKQRRRHFDILIYIYSFHLTRTPPLNIFSFKIRQRTRGVLIFKWDGVNCKEYTYTGIKSYFQMSSFTVLIIYADGRIGITNYI